MNMLKKQYIATEHIKWISLILFSIGLGILSLFVNPIFIIVAIIGIINIILIIKFPIWGLLSYLIIFLIRPAEYFPALSAVRPELLIGLLVLVCIILNQNFKIGKVTIPKDKISISLLLILIAIMFSFFTSYERSVTIDTAIMFIKIMVFYYLIFSIVTTKKRFITFLVTFLLLITYIALDSFRLYLSGDFVHTMDVDRLTGGSSAGGDANALGATLVLTIPIILASAFYFKHYLVRIALIGLSVFMTTMMVITASRSALIAFIGIAMAGIAFSKQKLLNLILVLILMITGWFLLPQQYQNRYMRFSEVGDDMNDVSSGRIEIWIAGLKMIAARPILGIGAGAFPWAHRSGEYGPPQGLRSHNLYVQILATMGFVGFGAWLFFLSNLIGRLKGLINAKHSEESYWIVIFCKSFLVIITGLLISGMFGHNLYRYTWFMIAGLAAAMYNIYQAEYSNDES